MGLKARFDVSSLAASLDRATRAVKAGAMKGIEDAGYEVGETAIAMAPKKSGALELAITVSEPKQGRDSKGRFGLATVSVYVDGNQLGADGDPVSRYATIMHEELQPYGDGEYFLGKGSEAKDGGSGNVGGKFLERALEEHASSIKKVVGEEIKRAIG